jgi:hypothetical protein
LQPTSHLEKRRRTPLWRPIGTASRDGQMVGVKVAKVRMFSVAWVDRSRQPGRREGLRGSSRMWTRRPPFSTHQNRPQKGGLRGPSPHQRLSGECQPLCPLHTDSGCAEKSRAWAEARSVQLWKGGPVGFVWGIGHFAGRSVFHGSR